MDFRQETSIESKMVEAGRQISDSAVWGDFEKARRGEKRTAYRTIPAYAIGDMSSSTRAGQANRRFRNHFIGIDKQALELLHPVYPFWSCSMNNPGSFRNNFNEPLIDQKQIRYHLH
jgi:hypothetical protein